MSDPRERLSIPGVAPSLRRGVAWTAGATGFVLLFVLGLDLWGALPEERFLPSDFQAARLLANSCSRSSVALISVVMASLFLAIPLTANMYTAQLVDLFVDSWIHRLLLGQFVFSAAFSLWVSSMVNETSQPTELLGVALFLVLLSLALLLPFLFSVLRSLDPDTIIARVTDSVVRSMRVRRGQPIVHAQFLLATRIRNLGNILLRTVDRADRDTSLAAVEALESCLDRYAERKDSFPKEWFDPDPRLFPGFSADAIGFQRNDRTWVELELLRQLNRGYAAAATRAPDVISALAETQRGVALRATQRGDEPARELAMRFFNNFLRESIRRRDLRALYDVLYQLRLFALKLWECDPERVVQLARHMAEYGVLAERAGLPFAHDLVAYDLSAVLAEVAREEHPEVEALAQIVLGIEREAGEARLSPSMLKARLQLLGGLAAAGRKDLAQRAEDTLAAAAHPALRTAASELLAVENPVYQEVTDRQRDLDWVPPVRREWIERAVDAHAATQA